MALRRARVGLLSGLAFLLLPACASSVQLEASEVVADDPVAFAPPPAITPEGEIRYDGPGPYVLRPDGTTTDVKTKFTHIPDRWPADIPRPQVIDLEVTMSESRKMLSFDVRGVAADSTDHLEVHERYVAALFEDRFELYEDLGTSDMHVESAYSRPYGKTADGYPIIEYVEIGATRLNRDQADEYVYFTVYAQTWVDEPRTTPGTGPVEFEDPSRASV